MQRIRGRETEIEKERDGMVLPYVQPPTLMSRLERESDRETGREWTSSLHLSSLYHTHTATPTQTLTSSDQLHTQYPRPNTLHHGIHSTPTSTDTPALSLSPSLSLPHFSSTHSKRPDALRAGVVMCNSGSWPA